MLSFCFLLLLPAAAVVATSKLPRAPPDPYLHGGGTFTEDTDMSSNKFPSTVAPRPNLWSPLTHDESADIIRFLHGHKHFNLTAAENATNWDNRIRVIEALPPNKTDVVAFWEGKAGKIPRYARAAIVFGASEEPYVEEFQIGPLPISSKTTVFPLGYYFTGGSSRQRIHNADDGQLEYLLEDIAEEIKDITLDLLRCTASGRNATCEIRGLGPLWHEGGRVVRWVQFWRNPGSLFDGRSLLPQGLYLKLDVTGRDPRNWKHLGWLYNGNYYDSTAEFRSAWSSPRFEKLEPNEEGEWTKTDMVGDGLPYDELPPPVSIQPLGGRYAIDMKEQYVEWMGFSFYVTSARDTGIRLYDIRYKGERLIYELGMEEAIAHYAGNDPVQSGTSYLDSFYGFGSSAYQLVPGFDCPTYATFLNATFHIEETAETRRDSICIFESDLGYPLQRHASGHYVSATKNIGLVVRSVSTIANYDYLFTYTFMLDGTIEVMVRASGYIQSAYWAKNEEYGYKVHDQLSGSLHDHVLTFKADLDIVDGKRNSLAKHSFAPAEVEYPWSKGTSRQTTRLEKKYITTEDHSKLNWGSNERDMYIIVNKDSTNRYGEPRGYRIHPSKGVIHLTIQDSPNLLRSQSFATRHLYVTKQKDTEVRASHPNNKYDPGNPIVDFEAFFDGESLEQEDLVVWFNLGMHHAPTTQDIPNTVFSMAQTGMSITPHNYFDQEPSRKTRQQIRINYGDSDSGQVTSVQTFGARNMSGSLDLTTLLPNYFDYNGDVYIPKNPYDPVRDQLNG